jgi:hypothetical protein
MRNRLLHDALRDFALESAALLLDDLRSGAEVEFDVIDEGGGRGPALYRYRPRTEAFIAERWSRLRELPACRRAAAELGAGAAVWLRVNGLRGEQAEPALQAMLERLYEDATSFGFPEERFGRLYREVEVTLYHDSVRARVVAPLRGVAGEADRVELGGGLALERGEGADAPPQAVWGEEGADEPAVLCVLERDAPADEGIPALEAEARFDALVTALRLWGPGFVNLGAPGWRRTDDGRWQPLPLGGGAPAPAGATFVLAAGEEEALRDFFAVVEAAEPPQAVSWALRRFEMGCERPRDDEALSDYLLALRALLDATTDAGEASLALRVAALCAEDGARRHVQRRMEAAVALERFVMGGGPDRRPDAESPPALVAEVERHLRALLRDVVCGYLDADLKSVADDILLETTAEPHGEIRARDLRAAPAPPAPLPHERGAPAAVRHEPRAPAAVRHEPRAPAADVEPDTSELEVAAVQPVLDGVTASADWDDYSAPV